ncbi:MAG: ribosome small subunit-dependent GTPase A [Gammaproteobacteria bacterium]|nr:MAG: ribosome small subunit-dependent GTPase A [Gammaproteobacteria bacterium]
MSRHGRIITRYGAEMLVEDVQDREIHRCTGRRRAAQAVCGDFVLWEPAGHGNGVVLDILPRRNLLSRPAPNGREKLIAANIDLAAVVIAHGMKPNWDMLDHYLVAVHNLPAEPLVLCNKADLAETDGGDFAVRLDEYRQIGYPVIECSVRTGAGMDAVAKAFSSGTAILLGQSGVGKSSLVKYLLPDLDIRIGALSAHSGEGQHTTSVATLYHLPEGGDLIDSPGVRDFRPGRLDRKALEHGFPEFSPFLGQCRFNDCTHRSEPGCAIRAAVEQGQILERRYRSYLRLLEASEAT